MKGINAVDFHSIIAEDFADSYSKSYSFRKRFGVWTDLFKKIKPKGKVLDVGCGSGIFSLHLAKLGYEVIGLDGSQQMINICNRHKSTNLKLVFNRELFPDCDLKQYGTFDAIIASSSLEYVSNIDFFLEKLLNQLAKDGLLIISFPNKESLFRYVERWCFKLIRWPTYYKFVKNIFSPSEFLIRTSKFNLEFKEIKYDGSIKFLDIFFSWLPNKYLKTMTIYVFQKKN
ncbi:MAG: class I SAM-dependent methyltransferase [Fulvivirga sp.]|uniref:class I SAM-dependent methyltransferase n=1 Tax=Fulvivirga sp. TaxID=1931237 RepID=UPI0032EC54A3